MQALAAITILSGATAVSGQEAVSATDLLLPPNATAGECYARVWVEPQSRTSTERVMVRPAREQIEVIPARYEAYQERVLVREASTRLEVIPATYGSVEEQLMVRPATTRLEAVPAVYRSATEDVLVRPAYTTWKKGTGPIQRIDEATGEIMCLVEVPAEYETVNTTVEVSGATIREVTIPAEYQTVRRQVLRTPATTREVTIPAEYDMVPATRLATPESERRVTIPAEYETVTKTEQIADGHLEWRSILCDTNMTNTRITQIQRALLQAGHNPGPIDGVIGRSTMRAVNSYQRASGLPADQYLNMETVRALGVIE